MRQIDRSRKHPVNTGNTQDGFAVVDAFLILNHEHNEDFLVGLPEVVFQREGSETCCPAAGNTTLPCRRVTCHLNNVTRIFGIADTGNNDPLCTTVQSPGNRSTINPRHAHQRCDGGTLGGANHVFEGLRVRGHVLGVQYDKVIAGMADHLYHPWCWHSVK